jgi:hypothetical protein
MKTPLPSFSMKIHCSFYFLTGLQTQSQSFLRSLISIMDALKTRDMDEVNSKATLLLQIGDDIYELATAYLNFV